MIDLYQLPLNILLKIVRYLSIADLLRMVQFDNHDRLSQLAIIGIRHATVLNLLTDLNCIITIEEADVRVISLCAGQLKRLEFGFWFDCDDNVIHDLFTRFQLPYLREIDLGGALIDVETLRLILRTCSELRVLIMRRLMDDFPDIACDRLEYLEVGAFIGGNATRIAAQCPNVRRFGIALFGYDEFDSQISSTNQLFALQPNLETLRLDLWNLGVIDDLCNIWAFTSLRSLTLLATETDDHTLRMISVHLSALEQLLIKTDGHGGLVTDDGFSALSQLPNLRELCYEVDHALVTRGIHALAECGRLELIAFPIYRLIPNTVTVFVRECPRLRRLLFASIAEATIDSVATCLRSLTGFVQHTLEICPHCDTDIWENDAVRTALNDVNNEAAGGLIILKVAPELRSVHITSIATEICLPIV